MVITRVLTPRSAVRALNWQILTIIAGSVGLGVIVVKSGLGNYISDGLLAIGQGNIAVEVAAIAIATTVLTNFVTNAAAAAILTPMALVVADKMQMDPVMLLALIGTCISFTFLNPYSHQSNLMVLKPGRYTNGTFFRFGLPLTVVCLATVIGIGYLLLS